MRPELPTGTVTFLFTDIEGSTRLLHSLGPDAYAEALAEHRRVLRESFAANAGVEIDTQGDAFFVAFPTAPGAVEAALAGTEALAHGPIHVRIGLHTGAPTTTHEGYVGIDVHRGARVAALAHGGQILVSPATAALLDSTPLRDLGLHRLKDFDGATRLFQLGPGDFPPLRTPGSVDLPSPPTSFLGRERELFDAVSIVVEKDPRVLTIVGPGGTGKTRFSIELARLLADEADGATLFVPLAPVHESALVLPTIADRLGAAGAEAGTLAAAVGDRRTHLVLDNLEHLLPDAARSVAELVAEAPSLRVIATSREPLRIAGETELDLPPLAESEAVTLFVERAQASGPSVEPDETVEELCRRLDHLPLALELAAARTKLLTPEQLLARLGQRLDLLRGTRDADERHATLRATITWSYDLLEPGEQELFAGLSVFAAGCTLESAETVCGAVLETLASLLDKSLVRRRTGRLGEERFWMLETIREFAGERLDESDEAESLRRRHAERMLELARSAHLSEDDDEPFELQVALAEREDLREALDWSAVADPVLGLELAIALETFWAAHAPDEGTRRTGDLLERGGAAPMGLRATGLRVLAGSAQMARRLEIADPAYEESLRVFMELGDRRGIASVRTRLAYRAAGQGDPELARRLIEESERDAKDRYRLIEAQNASLLAHLALEEDLLDNAEALLHRAYALASDLRWAWWQASTLNDLLDIALRRNAADEAERFGHAALALVTAHEDRLGAVFSLAGLARTANMRGELDRAGLLWGAAVAEGERLPGWHERRSDLWPLPPETEPAFADAFERGRTLDLWDAVALALGEDEAQTVP